nr:hypothetical protein [Tanacetum cinerariifolium]
MLVKVIPLNHVDDVPVVEPDQHNDVPVIPEPVLVDDNEDPEEDELKEEEDPQEEEDDMEVDIEEDENEPELTYPYDEMDPLNPSPPASESEPEDAIKIKNPIKHEDDTVPAGVHKVGESSPTPFLYEDNDDLLPGLMRKDIKSLFGKAKDELYGKLILDLGDEVRSIIEQGTTVTEKLVEKLGNAEDKVECKKLKKELKEARGFMFKERPNEAIDVPVNVRNDASRIGLARGQDATPAARECSFLRFMKCNPTAFRGTIGDVELMRWFEKTKSVFRISEFEEGKKVRFVDATLQGPALTGWKSKTATMGLETRFNKLALMCPTMVDPERVKVDAYIRRLTNNIKGEVTSSKPVYLSEVVRMAYKLMDQKAQSRDERILDEKKQKWEDFQSVYDQVPQVWEGWAKVKVLNRCPKKVKQEEVREVCGRAYAIKDAKSNGPNVVTGTFLLNNRYAFVLFDSGSDRSFVDTRFSSMLDIDSVKIGACYEVELADGRLVKHGAIIVYGKKVVHIPYRNKMLIVKSEKGVSRFKVISCIKAYKYIERGCHLFLAHVTRDKSKEKQIEDLPMIRDFLKVFPEELPGLPPSRQVEFRIDLVSGAVPVARVSYRLAPSEMKELLVCLQELL